MTHTKTASIANVMSHFLSGLRAYFAKVARILTGRKDHTASEVLRENARRNVFEDLYYPNEMVIRH